jgi:hypothetical protein
MTFVLHLLVQRGEDLLGGSSWKHLEFTIVSRFLAYDSVFPIGLVFPNVTVATLFWGFEAHTD